MRNTTKRNGKVIVRLNREAYAQLLAAALPAVIETEAENRRLLQEAKALLKKGRERTPEETVLLKLLSHLIQEFEQKFYQPGTVTPREALIELMAANDLKQADLVPLFGSKSIVSEVVNGKREISKAHAKALAARFHTSTDLFL